MKSMTGYGRAQLEKDGRLVAIEVSSVNRRNLEVSSSLPREWQSMERVLSEQIRSRFARGKFHVQVQVRRDGEERSVWDQAMMVQAYRELKGIAESTGEAFVTDGGFWLRLAGFAQENQSEPDWEEAWAGGVQDALNEALEAVEQMRVAEGAALANDVRERLGLMEERRTAIASFAREAPVNYREALTERLKRANLELDLDDERVLKEVAIFADRCDVEEELTRLGSHLAQFQEALGSHEPVGRKMDFLCQEINREVNTIGSKANHLEVTRLVIDAKNELERIREQIQNVE